MPAIGNLEISPWPFHPKTEIISGILKSECADLMKNFFRDRR